MTASSSANFTAIDRSGDSKGVSTGERWEWRSLTALFCDLVSSTTLLEQLDEEEYSAALRRFYAVVTESVRARAGAVAQYQGDAVVCHFGWPRASEDDASRAIRAALSLTREVRAIELPDGGRLTARAGIASGRVKLRADGGDFGRGTIGASLHRAARLQLLAPPGGTIVCAATRKLAGDLFEYREIPDQRLRGFSVGETVYRVLRERSHPTSRFEALHGRHKARLIGRDAELRRMLERLAAAREGSGTCVALSAPAGYGKSRLVSELRTAAEQMGTRVFTLQCAPETSNVPLQPIREFVEWTAGVLRRHDATERQARIARLFETVWGARGEAFDDLMQLLAPHGSARPPDETQSAALRRRRAFATLREVLYRVASGTRGLVFVVEDLHWADPSTIEFLTELSRDVERRPVLVLTTARPETQDLPGAEHVALSPLSDEEAVTLARQAADATDLAPDVIKTIVQRGEGVPLFIEEYVELMASAAASGHSRQAQSIPLSLDAIVRSRLDTLDPQAQNLACAGAAYGRRFGISEAVAITGLAEPQANAATAALVASRLVEPIRDPEGDQLNFSHGLIRDAIYSSMDAPRRREIHNQIANRVMASGGVDTIDENMLAEHLLRAGRPQQALEHFLAAAMLATQAGAAAEALKHLERALEALDQLPHDAPREALELRVRAIQGPALMVTRGPGAAAFGRVQRRAGMLLRRLNLHVEAVPVVYNTALHAWAQGNFAEADAIAAELDEIGRTEPSDGCYMGVNTMRGLVAWHAGHNQEARQNFKAVIERYDPGHHRDLYMVFLKEFGVFARFYLGLTETVLGNIAAGRRAADAALALARDVRRPHAVGFGMLARFNTAMLSGDVATAAAQAGEALEFAGRQGFPEFAAMARFCLGWVDCRKGYRIEGVKAMEAAAVAWAATGFETWRPIFAALTAHEAVAAGFIDTASELVERFTDTAERQAEAPFLIVRALIADSEGRAGDAARMAAAARATAAAQGARLWARVADKALSGGRMSETDSLTAPIVESRQ